MTISLNRRLLLVDLDGVLVYTMAVAGKSETVVKIHPNAPEIFERNAARMGILTHRARPEAEQIVSGLGINPDRLVCFFSAHDIWRSTIRDGNILRLLRDGTRKSFILRHLELRHGIRRENVAILDDMPAIAREMLNAGAGLAMVVPPIARPLSPNFSLEAAVSIFDAWCLDRIEDHAPIRLVSESGYLVESGSSRIFEVKRNNDLFNIVRTGGRKLRAIWSAQT